MQIDTEDLIVDIDEIQESFLVDKIIKKFE